MLLARLLFENVNVKCQEYTKEKYFLLLQEFGYNVYSKDVILDDV